MSVKVIMPNLSDYGAIELKEYIKKTTYKAFGITIVIFALFFIAYTVQMLLSEEVMYSAPLRAGLVELELFDPPPAVEDQAPPPPPPPPTIVNSGPASRAGTPVPIPDAEISPDLAEFADIEEVDRASAEGGDGLDLGGFADNVDFEGEGVKIETKIVEPNPDEFIFVEKEPNIDLGKLQGLVKYPELAKRAGVEGTVLLKILVGVDGKVRKSIIEDSDNSLLNQAALDAIKGYGYIPPAIQNKQPIMAWVTVPITFQLR